MARSSAHKTKRSMDHEVRAIILFDAKFSQTPPTAEVEKGGELTVGGTMSELRSEGGTHYFNVKFECGRSAGPNKSDVDFSAVYGVLFVSKSGDEGAAAEVVAKTVVWTKFAELFSVLNGHASSDMPHLPFQPHFRLEIGDIERE